MSGLGAAMVGGNGTRAKDDFYPTPPEATLALLPMIADFPQKLWEPACGDGAMARVLLAGGYRVLATDLVDRGWCDLPPRDFLVSEGPWKGHFGVVTNPPFNQAEAFIERACGMTPYVAMLLKMTFWNAARRMSLFAKFQPAAVHPLTWRLDFDGRGAPTMDCAWVVWRPGVERTVFEPLRRPAPLTPLGELLS